MASPDKRSDPRPDPILESLKRADQEHADRPTNRRWFWGFLVPFVLFFLLSMAYVLTHSVPSTVHAPKKAQFSWQNPKSGTSR